MFGSRSSFHPSDFISVFRFYLVLRMRGFMHFLLVARESATPWRIRVAGPRCMTLKLSRPRDVPACLSVPRSSFSFGAYFFE